MNKREYAQANKDWLTAKAQGEGVKPLPKGIYYKVLADGKADGKYGFRNSQVSLFVLQASYCFVGYLKRIYVYYSNVRRNYGY